jgi:ribokinase
MLRQTTVSFCCLPTTSDCCYLLSLFFVFCEAPAQMLPEEIFAYADILCPNETELELLSRQSVTNIKDVATAAQSLLRRGVHTVIVTLGENGSLLVTEDETFHAPIEEKVQAVDTTGAGDCYLGSFAYFYALGKDVKECMRRANKIASISVQFPGTQTSFPKRHQLPKSLFE